jgi:hypothetical protein
MKGKINYCLECSVLLTEKNCNKLDIENSWYICNKCKRKYKLGWWRKNHREKSKQYYIKRKEEFIHKYGVEEWKKKGREISANYRKNHREELDKIEKKITEDVISHYGGKCACCGETQLEFLTIDHINGGGSKEREKLHLKGIGFYYWLRKNNYPDGLQILCFNCNCGKMRNRGVCPHRKVLRW